MLLSDVPLLLTPQHAQIHKCGMRMKRFRNTASSDIRVLDCTQLTMNERSNVQLSTQLSEMIKISLFFYHVTYECCLTPPHHTSLIRVKRQILAPQSLRAGYSARKAQDCFLVSLLEIIQTMLMYATFDACHNGHWELSFRM